MWIVIRPQNCTVYYELPTMNNAGFTYRLDKAEAQGFKIEGSSGQGVYFFNTVIGLSHLCCHSILYSLSNLSRILQHFKHTPS